MKRIISYISILLLFFSLISCSTPSDNKYTPIVSGQSDAISDSIKHVFSTFDFPRGVIPVMVASPQIKDLIKTGVEPDIFFDEFEERLEDVDYDDFGLLVMVSKEPRLIQVRLGSYYDVYASLCGVTMGQKYLEIQQRYANGYQESAMKDMLKMICDNIQQRQSLSWYQKIQLSSIHSSINSAMEWLGTPSENLYGTLVTKPVFYAISFGSKMLGAWLWGIIFVFLLIIGIRFLIEITLQKLIPSPKWRELASKVIGGCYSLLFSLSAAGCSILLSSGRLEDLIAIKSFGIPNVEYFIANPSMFEQETNFLLAGAFFFFTALAMVLTNDSFLWAMYPNSIQQNRWASIGKYSKSMIEGSYNTVVKEGDPTPYLTLFNAHITQVSSEIGGLAIAALFFFPKAVLWTGIAYSIVKILLQLKSYVNVIHVRQANSMLEMPSVKALLLELIGGVLLGTILSMALTWIIDPFDKRSDDKHSDGNAIVEINQSFPKDLAGLYFVPIVEGKKVKGVTARIIRDKTGNYLMQVYSDKPIRRYPLFLDEEASLFHSDILGDGYIIYDERTKSITINFSDLWVLTN